MRLVMHPLVWVTALAACTGSFERTSGGGDQQADDGDDTDDDAPPSDEPDSPGPIDTPRPGACADRSPWPGPQPLRRLNNRELDATFRDLLGDTSAPARGFARPNLIAGFDTGAEGLLVNALFAEQLHGGAARLADQAASKPTQLAPCAAQPSPTCADTFVRTFGKRAFRRPLSDDEVNRYRRVFDAGQAEAGFGAGMSWTIQAMLESPSFLYRVERGQARPVAPGVTRPTPLEMASRLSYLLWGTMPDEALVAAAEEGRLGTNADVAREATRMLKDGRAAEVRESFFALWLRTAEFDDLAKNPAAFPAYDEPLRQAQHQELETFIARTTEGTDATFEALLTSPRTYVNAPLAKLYGLSAPSGTAFEPMEQDPSRRAGILTQGGLLALLAGPDEPSPVARGVFVLEKVLCADIPDPPANVDATPPKPDAKTSVRERLDTLTAPAACRGCHSLINPVGHGFAAYDAIGRWTGAEPNGTPIDTRGEVKDADDASGPFDGAVALANRLARSTRAQACFARQWFRHGVGRLEEEGDACSLATLDDGFRRAGGRLQALALALTQTDAFLYRPTEE